MISIISTEQRASSPVDIAPLSGSPVAVTPSTPDREGACEPRKRLHIAAVKDQVIQQAMTQENPSKSVKKKTSSLRTTSNADNRTSPVQMGLGLFRGGSKVPPAASQGSCTCRLFAVTGLQCPLSTVVIPTGPLALLL